MAALITNTGLVQIFLYMIGFLNNTALKVHLYVNNYVPQLTDTATAYTECTLPGYASIVLSPSIWTYSIAAGLLQGQYPSQTFTFTTYTGSAVTIYGYYITDTNSGGTLMWAEYFSVPYTVPLAGGSLSLQPFFNDHNC